MLPCRIPRPGGVAGSPATDPKPAAALSSSPPQKGQPSPAHSFGSASPPKQASSPDRGRSSPQRAPLEVSSSSRALHGSGSASPTPTVRSSGYGQRATAARVGARAAARAVSGAVSPTKLDTRKQLEDIMRDLQDIKKDLGMPMAEPAAAALPPAGQLEKDAAAAEEAVANVAAGAAADAPAEAAAVATTNAAAEAAASADLEMVGTEAAADEGGAQAGNTDPASPAAAEGDQTADSLAAEDDQAAAASQAGASAEEDDKVRNNRGAGWFWPKAVVCTAASASTKLVLQHPALRTGCQQGGWSCRHRGGGSRTRRGAAHQHSCGLHRGTQHAG